MKRVNLHSIIFYTILGFLVVPLYGQQTGDKGFVFQSITLSDFGDGYDAAKSLIWQPRFSDSVVQATVEGAAVVDPAAAAGEAGEAPAPTGVNYDPERAGVRYLEGRPDGIGTIVAGPQKFVLGVKAQFTQLGYNWIELHPRIAAGGAAAAVDPAAGGAPVAGEPVTIVEAEESTQLAPPTLGAVENAPDLNVESTPFRIPFTGIAQDLSVWVWGGYYGWWVEAYVRDYLGYQYRLPLGDLMFVGWKYKRIGITPNILQGRKRLPAFQSLTFEMFKLWSFPSEKVDQLYVYFDLLQHVTMVSTEIYNGKSLERQLW